VEGEAHLGEVCLHRAALGYRFLRNLPPCGWRCAFKGVDDAPGSAAGAPGCVEGDEDG
jgi:hypothetical protein